MEPDKLPTELPELFNILIDTSTSFGLSTLKFKLLELLLELLLKLLLKLGSRNILILGLLLILKLGLLLHFLVPLLFDLLPLLFDLLPLLDLLVDFLLDLLLLLLRPNIGDIPDIEKLDLLIINKVYGDILLI
tara:strand:- start:830 stop:1228 length:399 start_codon:yes stop_codon:yes gene_type:complete